MILFIDLLNKSFKSGSTSPLVLYNEEVEPDLKKISELLKEGYDEIQSEKALSNCQNDLEKSSQLLKNGKFDPINQIDVTCRVSYDKNPNMYLVMELLDVIYNLEDHCCICGDPIPRVFRPSPCEKSICRSQYSTMKIGVNLISEIRRDIRVSNFLFTAFVSAIGMHFLIPPPPPLTTEALNDQKSIIEINYGEKVRQAFDPSNKNLPLNHDPDYLRRIIKKKIPPFTILAKYNNDKDLEKAIGKRSIYAYSICIINKQCPNGFSFIDKPRYSIIQIRKVPPNSCVSNHHLKESQYFNR